MNRSMDKFYGALSQLNVVNKQLEDKREKLQEHVQWLQSNMSQINLNKNLRKTNKDLAKLFYETINTINECIEAWKVKLDENLDNEKLRSMLKNHFIVMIFGRVKAGKSTLANFIANHNSSNEKAEFFVFNKDKKSLDILEQNSFETDRLECTNAIQGFNLSALTWIDTPGLGSITKENGDLAKKYFGSADYIIYPSSSTSPLQEEEIQELKEIITQAKKEVSIIITKSDIAEQDEKDGEIINIYKNKTQETRKAQENECKARIKEIFGEDANKFNQEIISLSTFMADNSIKENDEKVFAESGMIEFYDILSDIIINKSEIIRANSPTKELMAISNKILQETKIETKINDFNKKISEIKTSLDTLKIEARNDITVLVSKEVWSVNKDINKENIKAIVSQIDKQIQEEFKKKIEKNITKVIEDFNSAFINFINELKNDWQITDKTAKISTSTKKRNGKIGMAAGTAAGATLGSVIPGIGTTVGAIVGGMIGGMIGGYVGKKIGEATGDDSYESINVGDTKDETIHNIIENRTEYYTKQAELIYDDYINGYFFINLENSITKMSDIYKEFNTKIESFNKELL